MSSGELSCKTLPEQPLHVRVVGEKFQTRLQCRPATGAAIAFDVSDQRLAESLASQAAVALTNKRLLSELIFSGHNFFFLANRKNGSTNKPSARPRIVQ